MGGVVLAWLVGMGLISWRYAKEEHSPPAPGDLAVASGAFAIAGVVGMVDDTVGNLLAWGLDAAALLRILDGQSPIPSPLSALGNQANAAGTRLTSATSSTAGGTIQDGYTGPGSAVGTNKQGGAAGSTPRSYTPK